MNSISILSNPLDVIIVICITITQVVCVLWLRRLNNDFLGLQHRLLSKLPAKDFYLNNLTWKCHVCGKERPDQLISVRSTEIDNTSRNVRYCNDSPSCYEGAGKILEDFVKQWKGENNE